MGDIINLNKQRKAKTRAKDEVRAKENRAKYGRTRHEKQAEKSRVEKLERHVDSHQRETKDE